MLSIWNEPVRKMVESEDRSDDVIIVTNIVNVLCICVCAVLCTHVQCVY